MRFDFDLTGTTQQVAGPITFIDYPNRAYVVMLKGYYYAIVYNTGDVVYFQHNLDDYYISQVSTHDGLTFKYQE